MKNFFIVSDSPIFTKGMIGLLEKKHTVIGTCKGSFEALKFINNHKPSIAILDVNNHTYLSNMQIAVDCKKSNNPTKIIVFIPHLEIDFQKNKEKTNIQGYLVKESSIESIEECIAAVSNGISYVAPEISVNNFYESYIKHLTGSELKILQLISNKSTSSQIAENLFISRRTVDKHRGNIIKKLNLSSINSWAIKHHHLIESY